MPNNANAGSNPTGEDINKLPQISGHTLLRYIGDGSYGRVYLAKCTANGQYRAVKIIARSSFSNDTPFEREFGGVLRYEPISRSHEGMVDILHVERDPQGRFFYYVMEIADDEQTGQEIDPDKYRPKTLATVLRQQGRLSVEECIQTGLGLAYALTHLHKNGLIHRNIKPSNIIFKDGQPHFADIGLVTLAVEQRHTFVGTEGYVPPEGPGWPGADLYALGKVLYEMATGKDRCEFSELPEDVDTMPDINRFKALNEIILKACDNNKEKRYKTAHDMHTDLLALRETNFVFPPRPRRRRSVVLGTVAILAVLLGIFSHKIVNLFQQMAYPPIDGIPRNQSGGTGGTLKITSGSEDFKSVSSASKTLTVVPGAKIGGTIKLQALNFAVPDAVAPLIWTPSWGDHSNSWQLIAGWIPPGQSAQQAHLSFTAPTTPGTYHIIFAFAWQMRGDQVASCSDWNLGFDRWNDGHDIAELSAAQISEAQLHGYTEVNWLGWADAGHSSTRYVLHQYEPADALTLVVAEKRSH